ncbi:MAG: hypothetical protein HYW05_02045 [Candidatus Diapherotrites archaeon]|nr:hypothetical protein [Candidatus Diapherotrites archaeon]
MALTKEQQLLRNMLLRAFRIQGYLEKEQWRDLRSLLGRGSRAYRNVLIKALKYKKMQRTIRKSGPRPV